MSDDRWSKEEREIEAAAAAAGKEPPRCAAVRRGQACELVRGHTGNHLVTLADGTKRYWWRVPQSEFERVLKELEPKPAKPLLPGSVTARPGKDESK